MSRKTIRKEMQETIMREIIVGAYCDQCGGTLKVSKDGQSVQCIGVITGHHDWGNDSIDSIGNRDFCSLSCAVSFAHEYAEQNTIESTAYIEIQARNSKELALIRADTENYKAKYMALQEKLKRITE